MKGQERRQCPSCCYMTPL
uniref:Uncharacterized protein n=1 Tax=Rhizophora mucronata TaxID=61149 RepID=A0A2P2QN88_RHIMU